MTETLIQTAETAAEMKPQKVSKLSLLKPKEEMTVGDYLRNYSLEILAVFFWVYTLTKVFVFDIDLWLVDSFFPDYLWILNFKLVFILALASLTWLWIGARDIVVWFLYIAFYPLVLLLIRLPYFIFKQQSWLLAFATINAVASFFTNLKYGLIFTTIFFASFAGALFLQPGYLLLVAAAILVVLLLVAYVKSFITALKPTVIFQIYSRIFKGARTLGHTSFALDAEIRDLPIEQLEPKQLEKWNTSLQSSVLFNRFCLFTATKLRDYQKSEWRMIPSIFGLLRLAAFTVVSFSGVYYALFKWEPSLFRHTEEPTFFTFLYYSFNNLVLNSTAELAPATMLSQSMYMLQASLSLLLVAIIVTLYISHRTQKSSSELDEVITTVETEARNMEGFIESEYKIPNIETAIERLKEVQSGLVQLIYWFSKAIK